MVNMRKRILQAVAECEFKEGCLSIKVEYITNKRNGNISGVKAAAALACLACLLLSLSAVPLVTFQKPKPSQKFTRCSVIW